MKSFIASILMGVVVIGLLTGCQRDNHPRLPEAPGKKIFPTVGPAAIATNGGHALGLTGRSGGDGGSITVAVTSGHLLRDDGRTLASPATNLVTTAETDDGVVTYAELSALSAPVIAGDVATFTLTGDGLWIFGGVRLDLTDAPYTGTTPATDVLFVQINSDEMIRIDGRVLGTRVGNEAVGVGFSSTHADGVTFRGVIDTRGYTGFDGGDVGLNAAAGDLIATGTIYAGGGDADAANDGGDGGDAGLSSASGDLLLNAGSLRSFGGLGQLDGGTGGDVSIDAFASASISFHWGVVSSGGDATDGDGGDAGTVDVNGGASTSLFATFEANGGASVDGNGGTGGAVSFNGFTVNGTLTVYSHGGDTTAGSGGFAGGADMTVATADGLNFDVYANGGRGDTGGDAGGGAILSGGLVSNTDLWVQARGGVGTTGGGGIGGGAFIIGDSGTVTVVNTLVEGDLRGGNTVSGTGGDGGNAVVFNFSALSMSVLGCAVDANVDGGSGDTGGVGGDVGVSVDGSVTVALYGSSNGGQSFAASGANAGEFLAFGNSVDVYIQATANGGVSTGGTGGAGGLLTVDADDLGTGGSAWLEGWFVANGGASDDTGGVGGDVLVESGDVGSAVLWNVELTLYGGAGDLTGGPGGILVCDSINSIDLVGAQVVADGGDSNAGDGGQGGDLLFFSDEGDINISGNLRASGGSGVTSGGIGGNLVVVSDDDAAGDAGDIEVSGVVTLNGGDATTGTGGDGGFSVQDATSGGIPGAILQSGTIRAEGGDGATGGVGGDAILDTNGAGIGVTGRIFVRGGIDNDGGNVGIGFDQAGGVTLGSTCVINADGGAGAGLAGTIDLDPTGAGPNNPNLVESVSASLSTRDGDGTDQSATNITRD